MEIAAWSTASPKTRSSLGSVTLWVISTTPLLRVTVLGFVRRSSLTLLRFSINWLQGSSVVRRGVSKLLVVTVRRVACRKRTGSLFLNYCLGRWFVRGSVKASCRKWRSVLIVWKCKSTAALPSVRTSSAYSMRTCSAANRMSVFTTTLLSFTKWLTR